MSKTQSFVAAIVSLAIGVGLLVTGIVLKEGVLTATGSSLIGVAVGAMGLPRPQDVTN